MPIINRVADLQLESQPGAASIHENPDCCSRCTARAALGRRTQLEALRLDDEVVTGMGRTGVVGVIKGRKPGAGKSTSPSAPTWTHCRSAETTDQCALRLENTGPDACLRS